MLISSPLLPQTGFLSGGIEHLFDDYLLSSDSDDVVNEAAAYHNQAADSGEHGGSECATQPPTLENLAATNSPCFVLALTFLPSAHIAR